MTDSRKIVILGQFGVGKSSLMRRFLLNTFSDEYRTTLGVQIKKKEITLPSGQSISLIIWDLEGFSSVSKTRSSYLLGSDAFIYVFDITRSVTYAALPEDIKYIKGQFPDVLLKVVGNKLDLGDAPEVKAYLKLKSIDIHGFVSAKSGEGVEDLFMEIAESLNLSNE